MQNEQHEHGIAEVQTAVKQKLRSRTLPRLELCLKVLLSDLRRS